MKNLSLLIYMSYGRDKVGNYTFVIFPTSYFLTNSTPKEHDFLSIYYDYGIDEYTSKKDCRLALNDHEVKLATLEICPASRGKGMESFILRHITPICLSMNK